MGQFWTTLIAAPGLYSLPCRKRSIYWLVFGMVSHLLSYAYTDSMGSAWCFANTFQAIFAMADYMFFGETGDDKQLAEINKAKVVKQE